jgi:hypothetical protein
MTLNEFITALVSHRDANPEHGSMPVLHSSDGVITCMGSAFASSPRSTIESGRGTSNGEKIHLRLARTRG